jgi:dihydroflavonol-4-reductase
VKLPTTVNVAGARLLEKLHGWRGTEAPLDPREVEMGEHYWWIDSRKAREELGFAARDAQETLHDTVRYLNEKFRGKRKQGAPAFSGTAG